MALCKHVNYLRESGYKRKENINSLKNTKVRRIMLALVFIRTMYCNKAEVNETIKKAKKGSGFNVVS